MSKQTSVEWLWEKIDNNDAGEIPLWVYDLLEQAKEMHKVEIINAADQNQFEDIDGLGICDMITKGEQYYQETFKKD